MGQPLHDEPPDDRGPPHRRRVEQRDGGVAVRHGLVLDGPPQKHRNERIVGVFVALQQFSHNRQAIRPGQPFAGTRQLTADRRALLRAGQCDELIAKARRDLFAIRDETDRPGAHVLVGMIQQLRREILVEVAAGVQRPERLQRQLAVVPQHPLAQVQRHRRVASLRQDAPGLADHPVVGILQQRDEVLARPLAERWIED